MILWNKNPELFLQVLPTANKKVQKLNLPNQKLRQYNVGSKDKFPLFPNTVKQNKIDDKFKTIVRDQVQKQNNNGKALNVGQKHKYYSRDSNSPAVPIPAHSRLWNHSTKETNWESNFSKDLKVNSKGINFELKPLHKRFNQDINKSWINERKKTYNEFLNAQIWNKSRATTGELQKRSKQKEVMSEAPKLHTQQRFEMRNHENSKDENDNTPSQNRVKSLANKNEVNNRLDYR